MKTYKVRQLKKVVTVTYYLIFLALLVVGGLLIHYFEKKNNFAVLAYVALLLLDGLFCYYLSIAAAVKPVSIGIDENSISIDNEKMPLADVIEYDLSTRRIAPRDILTLYLPQERKIRIVGKLPWTASSSDFDTLVAFFKSRPQVTIGDNNENLPTAE